MGQFPYMSKTFYAGLVLMGMGIYLFVSGEQKEGTEIVMVGLGLIGLRQSIERANA